MTRTGPRQRLLSSAIALMCERGVHATGLTDLLSHSRTARGSIYQHFPGGKSELIEQATLVAGREIDALLGHLVTTCDGPAQVYRAMVEHWKRLLAGSDYAIGCPILAAAQAGPAEPAVRAASAAVFAGWVDTLGAALRAAGADDAASRSTAGAAISAMEGAIAHSRSIRSTIPLDDVATALCRLMDDVTRSS